MPEERRVYYETIDLSMCPFAVGDRVSNSWIKKGETPACHTVGTVVEIDDIYVWVRDDGGRLFYRNWTYQFDKLWKTPDCGLAVIKKYEPPKEEPEPDPVDPDSKPLDLEDA